MKDRPRRVQYPCLQPLADKPQKGAVLNAFPQHTDHPVMIQGVKETFDVRLYYIVVASKLELHRQFVYRIHCPHPRAIAITTAQEILLIDGFEEASGRHLQQLILHSGNAEGTQLAVPFRDIVALDEFGPIPLLLEAL